ncbi:MAG: hypothetical protein MAG431_00733 [Chloroflexi bacterium]|nr:hypothetical protein [Chloroflexota bacterium]
MTQENVISLTLEAATAVKDLLAEQEQEDLGLRLFISGVG